MPLIGQKKKKKQEKKGNDIGDTSSIDKPVRNETFSER